MSHNAIWIITNEIMTINGKLAVILYTIKAYLVDVKKIDIGFKAICAITMVTLRIFLKNNKKLSFQPTIA